MNFFIVSQRERRSYIWAPDDRYYHHKFVKEIRKDDIIFIYHKTNIIAISKAVENARRMLRPEFRHTNWGEDGYNVDLEIINLEFLVKPYNHSEEIKKFKENEGKYFPFKEDGFIVQGYTYKISTEFAKYLFSLVKLYGNERLVQEYNNKIENYQLEDMEKNILYIEEEKCITGEEKESIIKVRINQNIFRQKLLNLECKLCGFSNEKLLIASHIKPWSESDDIEKLHIYNGFLFCPHHDKVFDKFLISFEDSGKIIISQKLSVEDRILLNLRDDMKIKLSDGNKKYLKWHREKFFEQNKV